MSRFLSRIYNGRLIASTYNITQRGEFPNTLNYFTVCSSLDLPPSSFAGRLLAGFPQEFHPVVKELSPIRTTGCKKRLGAAPILTLSQLPESSGADPIDPEIRG